MKVDSVSSFDDVQIECWRCWYLKFFNLNHWRKPECSQLAHDRRSASQFEWNDEEFMKFMAHNLIDKSAAMLHLCNSSELRSEISDEREPIVVRRRLLSHARDSVVVFCKYFHSSCESHLSRLSKSWMCWCFSVIYVCLRGDRTRVLFETLRENLKVGSACMFHLTQAELSRGKIFIQHKSSRC